jgi:hypothetical protein
MAIINSYPKDKNIQDKDAWIGTDSYNRQTRQYTAEAVAKYLNVKGKVSIAGQVNYKFVQLPKTGAGTIALTAGGGDGTPFSNLTEFKISKVDLSGQTVVAYLDYLVNEEILMMNQTNKEEFGHYKITSYVVDPDNTSFYTLRLSFVGGNGSIRIDDYYDIVNFAMGVDKNFVFTQAVASTSWEIKHNLGKFPSVSVVNNNNILMYGETTYVDTNNLTINFSAGFSGKAYLN